MPARLSWRTYEHVASSLYARAGNIEIPAFSDSLPPRALFWAASSPRTIAHRVPARIANLTTVPLLFDKRREDASPHSLPILRSRSCLASRYFFFQGVIFLVASMIIVFRLLRFVQMNFFQVDLIEGHSDAFVIQCGVR